MIQIVDQTHKEKMKMYMKQSKKKLAEMLIACNEVIPGMPIQVHFVDIKKVLKRTSRKRKG